MPGKPTYEELKRRIAELESANEILRESEDRFKTILENVNDVIVYADVNGTLIDVNGQTESLSGYKRDELIGKKIFTEFDVLSPTDHEKVVTIFNNVIAGKPTTTTEFELFRKDRTKVIVEANSRTIKKDGKIIGILNTLRDITARRKSEEKIRKREEQMSLALKAADFGLWDWHIPTGKLGMGKRPVGEIGYVDGDIDPYVDSWYNKLHPDDAKAVADAYNNYISGHNRLFTKEYRILSKSNEYRWVQVYGKIIEKDSDGNPVRFVGIYRDINDQKNAEAALRESEKRRQDILDSMIDGITITNMEGKIIDINKATTQQFGYTKEEVLGKTPAEVFLDEADALKFHTRVEDMLGGESIIGDEYLGTHKNGTTFPIGVSLSVIKDNDGTLNSVIATHRDISRQKEAEKQLRDSEEKFKMIFENANDEIIYHTVDGKVIDVNDKIEEIFGYTREELLGKHLRDYTFFSPENLEKVITHLKGVIKEEVPKLAEFEGIRKDGSKVFIEVNYQLIKKDGKVEGVLNIVRDVTERKLAEKTLKASEERYRVLAENVKDVIWIMDLDTLMFPYFSPSVEPIIFYTPSETVTMSLVDFVSPETYHYLMGILKEELDLEETEDADPSRSRTVEFEVLKKDGSAVWTESIMRFLRNSKGKAVSIIGVTRDISLRKKTREELKVAKRNAEESAKAKSQFLANMSHEIRTPLNGVNGMSSLLLDTELTQEQQEYAEAIQTSAYSLMSLVNDILDFSKIEAGKITLEKYNFNLRLIIDEITDILTISAHKKGLNFTCNIHPDVPSFYTGDPGKLKQILVNLTDNAVKFTEKGEVVINITAEKETEVGVTLSFAIRDTGIGIPADRMDSLFKSFYQADASMSRKYGGTGLGLAISKQLSELMGGSICVESTEGDGTTFWFKIVLEKQKPSPDDVDFIPDDLKDKRSTLFDSQVKQYKEESVSAGGLKENTKSFNFFLDEESRKKVRILLVEDNVISLNFAMQLIKKMNFSVDTASNGKEAISALETSSYDLVLMDIQMPEMDGFEAMKHIRDHRSKLINPEVPVVAMTAHAMKEDQQQCLEAGMDDYISKPVRPNTLASVIDRVLKASKSKNIAK